MLQGIVNFVLGTSHDDSDHTHYEISSNDVVLPIPIVEEEEEEDGVNSFDELIEDEYSEDVLAQKDPVYYAASVELRRWMDYIINITGDRFKEPRAMISLVFKTFAEEYPLRESVCYDAIEYMRNREEYDYRAAKNARFKTIFYTNLVAKQETRADSCKAIPNVENVFLVNLQHDYVYGSAIECALFRHNAELWQKSQQLFNKRRRMTRACPIDHLKSDKLCPSEWILYVDQTSEFYQYCSKQLKDNNPLVDHRLTASYVNAENLSFYLVLFLCGELMRPTQDFSELSLTEQASNFSYAYYGNINQWRKLPLWFLDIWYAGHPKTI